MENSSCSLVGCSDELIIKNLLENGLLLETLSMEQRTRDRCVNAMKWAWKTKDSEQAKRIIRMIPEDLLIHAFFTVNLHSFQ
jgi:hypothetical protein